MYQPLYPQGKGPQYPLNMRLSRLQSQSGLSGEDKSLLPCQETGLNLCSAKSKQCTIHNQQKMQTTAIMFNLGPTHIYPAPLQTE
jgi:hypothetical protein